jgi:hypothetical protein
MTDRLRREVIAYFEQEVGPPPAGTRERVLAELGRGRPQPAAGRRRRLAGAVAVAIALLVVTSLSLIRLAQRDVVGPARPGAPAASPGVLSPTTTPPVVTGQGPLGRSGPAVAFDQARGELVVFGGAVESPEGVAGPATAETWTWAGGGWTLQHPATAPSPRRDSQIAYDAERGQVVLFGGRAQLGYSSQVPGVSDTWTWDGRSWTEHRVDGPVFDPQSVMEYDPKSRLVLLFRIRLQETWSWDGQRWSRPQSSNQPNFISATMAWDGHRTLLLGRVAVAGGLEAGGSEVRQTWAWDANRGWTKLSPASQPPEGVGPAAYDPERRRLVALAQPGRSDVTETWLWDGAKWSRQPAAHQPPPLALASATAVYDAGSKLVLAYGRQLRSPVSELWAWDGRDWRLLARD